MSVFCFNVSVRVVQLSDQSSFQGGVRRHCSQNILVIADWLREMIVTLLLLLLLFT
jgi:hypothetical protein